MLSRLFHIAVNATDLDRTVDFYTKLGFTRLQDRTVRNEAVRSAFAVPSANLRFVHMRLGDDENATLLDIVQWYEPDTAAGPGVLPQHQVGITRFAVLTDDTQATYDRLVADGVEFLTEPTTVMTPEGGWKVALALDPDGTVIQLTELVPA
ncbi:MAG TPA: VOC family protein [Pseudonocardiaceae bacterium]|nr:VOC family protein [Pseudonocardiaceae bacterium]